MPNNKKSSKPQAPSKKPKAVPKNAAKKAAKRAAAPKPRDTNAMAARLAEGNGMDRKVSEAVAAAGMNGMQGSNIRILFSDFTANTSAYTIARHIAAKLAVLNPGRIAITNGVATLSPAGVVAYLIWALFDSARDSGVFSQAAVVNAWPKFNRSWAIPNAWAQVIQAIRPFTRGQVACSLYDNVTTALPSMPTAQQINSTATSFAQDAYLSVVPYPVAGAGLEDVQSGGIAPIWTDIYTAATYISDVLEETMATVEFGEIPMYAADCSAYTVVRSTGIQGPLPDFHPELAYLLGQSGAGSSTGVSHLAYIKAYPAVPSSISSPAFWFVEVLQGCKFLPGANMKRVLETHVLNTEDVTKKSKHGRIVSAMNPKAGQVIRYIFGYSNPIDSRPWKSLVALSLAYLAGGTASFPQGYAYTVACHSALMAKMLPYAYSSLVGTVPCVHDPQWRDVALPLAIASYINGVGPVVVDGRYVYPCITDSNGNADMRGAWMQPANLGLGAATNKFFSGQYSLTAGANQTTFAIGAFTFSTVGYPTPTNYGITPKASTSAFLYVLDGLFKNGGVFNNGAGIIKLDSVNPFGKSIMLTFGDTTSLAAGNGPQAVSDGTNKFAAIDCTIADVAAYHALAGVDLGNALTLPYGLPTTSNGSASTVDACNPPYRASGGGVSRPSLISAFVRNTLSPNVSSAYSQMIASAKTDMKVINGQTVDVNPRGDLFGALLDTLVAPIFGDAISEGIRSSPIGAIGSNALPFLLGGPGLLVADKMGITDGVLSTFGLTSPIKGPQMSLKNALGETAVHMMKQIH